MLKKSMHLYESKQAQYNSSQIETIEAVKKMKPFFDPVNKAVTLDSVIFSFTELIRDRILNVAGIYSNKSSYKIMTAMIKTFDPRRDEAGKGTDRSSCKIVLARIFKKLWKEFKNGYFDSFGDLVVSANNTMTRLQEGNKKLQQTSSFIKFDKSEYKFKSTKPWGDDKPKTPLIKGDKKLDSKESDEEEETLNVLDRAKQVQLYDRPGEEPGNCSECGGLYTHKSNNHKCWFVVNGSKAVNSSGKSCGKSLASTYAAKILNRKKEPSKWLDFFRWYDP